MRGWMTRAGAVVDTANKVREVLDSVRKTESLPEIEVEHYQQARAVQEGLRACEQIRRVMFFAATGVADLESGERVTYFLSKAANAYHFVQQGVVSWTGWIGQQYTKARNMAEEGGRLPAQMVYGPPVAERARAVGPIADYEVVNGQPRLLRFLDIGPTAEPRAGVPAILEQPATVVAEFDANLEEPKELRLSEIIQTLDLAQDKELRGPMSGAFILTGGPGTGKTTVALHRLRYLLNEQVEMLPREDPAYARLVEGEERFFTEESFLVLVWKAHLRPYLHGLLSELYLPNADVRQVEDWVIDLLRPYEVIGPGRARLLREEPEGVREAKLGLPAEVIRAFLAASPRRAQSVQALTQRLPDVLKPLGNRGSDVRLEPPAAAFHFTAAGLSAYIDRQRALLQAAKQELRLPDEAVSQAREVLDGMRAGEMERLGDHEAMLRDLYDSDGVEAWVAGRGGVAASDAFRAEAGQQRRERRISLADCFVLLELIRAATSGANLTARRLRPLPEYSHVVLDEAQYSHPALIRLVQSRLRRPVGSMTLVGDIEQRVTTKGGLVHWEAAGLDIPPERIRRLDTSYRWSEPVYSFLVAFRTEADIDAALGRPRRFLEQGGVAPLIASFPDRAAEAVHVAKEISRLRAETRTSRWSVLVVCPQESCSKVAELLLPELESYGITGRRAQGADVAQNIHEVVITDPEHVVGLEYEVVFLMAWDQHEGRCETPESRRSMWVPVTRAKKTLQVTYVGAFPFLERPAFVSWRQRGA